MPKAKTKEKKITVALSQIDKVCRACGLVSETTCVRRYQTANYMGPCGDSFCYASCDLSSCRTTEARVCETCERAKKEPA